ncbi:MAG: DNA polymerase III subunit delta [Anaerolineales bacterium]|nr:DNA polymerase III subunit delta [Anaerolineales bacterium]
MSESKPRLYLLYGDDTLTSREILHRLSERIGEPSTADMNISTFSARNLDLAEFETICYTMPFLADRRLVLLNDGEAITSKTPWLDKFLAVLESAPPQTAVVVLESFDSSEKNSEENYQKKSPLFKWAQKHPDASYIKACILPQKFAFENWISNRVREYGGEIDLIASHALAEVTAGDTMLADQEIIKLLNYTDFQRPVTSEDIDLLTPLHGQADIFTLVDAFGNQDARTALNEFHHLLEEVSLQVIFAMILRQFRLLIQARDCLDRGLNVKEFLKIHPYVADKITVQAKNFSKSELLRIYAALQRIDYQSKTSSVDLVVTLDSLIADCTAG